MTPKEINDLKKAHNAELEKGKKLYAEVIKLHKSCLDMQATLEKEEGPDYDPIPVIFGSGFWVDPDL